MGIIGDFVVWFRDGSTRTVQRFGDYLTTRPAQRNRSLFAAFGYYVTSVTGDTGAVQVQPLLRTLRPRLGVSKPRKERTMNTTDDSPSFTRGQRVSLILAALCAGGAALLALLPLDWIEEVFGVDPDAGSGLLEVVPIIVLSVVSVTLAARVALGRRGPHAHLSERCAAEAHQSWLDP